MSGHFKKTSGISYAIKHWAAFCCDVSAIFLLFGKFWLQRFQAGKNRHARLSVCLWWKRRDRQTDRRRTKRFACQIVIGLSWELRCAGLSCSTSAPVGKLLKSWNVSSLDTQPPCLRECSFTAARPSLLSIFHPLPASALLSRFLPVQWQTQQMSKRSPPSAACLSEVLCGNWDVQKKKKKNRKNFYIYPLPSSVCPTSSCNVVVNCNARFNACGSFQCLFPDSSEIDLLWLKLHQDFDQRAEPPSSPAACCCPSDSPQNFFFRLRVRWLWWCYMSRHARTRFYSS